MTWLSVQCLKSVYYTLWEHIQFLGTSYIPSWGNVLMLFLLFLFLILFLFIFRERGRREKEREWSIDVWEIQQSAASRAPPAGNLACNPGICPDWEPNQQPFGSQASTQSTESYQPGLFLLFLLKSLPLFLLSLSKSPIIWRCTSMRLLLLFSLLFY